MRRLGSAHRVLFVLALGFGAAPARAQQPADAGWDVIQARGRTREIDFTTTEGTWTALDVSPDGTWVVFDLLGHIYRVPIGGGTAQPLTQSSGLPGLRGHHHVRSVDLLTRSVRVGRAGRDGRNDRPSHFLRGYGDHR
jgi:hypothetical protein